MPRAPKVCSHLNCTSIVYPPARRCAAHTVSGWASSPRTESSRRTGPHKWKVLRARVLQRDDRLCQIRGPRCLVVGEEVDHVIPTHLGGRDSMDNAQCACKPCHPIRPRARLGQLVDSVVPQQDSVVLAVTLASTAKAPLTCEYTPPVGEGTRCHAGTPVGAGLPPGYPCRDSIPHGQKQLESPHD